MAQAKQPHLGVRKADSGNTRLHRPGGHAVGQRHPRRRLQGLREEAREERRMALADRLQRLRVVAEVVAHARPRRRRRRIVHYALCVVHCHRGLLRLRLAARLGDGGRIGNRVDGGGRKWPVTTIIRSGWCWSRSSPSSTSPTSP